MKEHGLLSDGIVTMINKEAEQTFANERAAIAFNGSWCINIYESMNPKIKYKVALPPRVNLNRPMYIWGGTTSFVINAKSQLKEDAIKFAKWLSADRQQRYLAKQTLNIPANRSCADVLSGHTIEFAAAMDNVVHPRLLPMEEYPLVTEAFDKGIQSILIGEATPEGVAKTVQEAKVREMEKAAHFKEQRLKK
jgi:maltose-binding protein MalE